VGIVKEENDVKSLKLGNDRIERYRVTAIYTEYVDQASTTTSSNALSLSLTGRLLRRAADKL